MFLDHTTDQTALLATVSSMLSKAGGTLALDVKKSCFESEARHRAGDKRRPRCGIQSEFGLSTAALIVQDVCRSASVVKSAHRPCSARSCVRTRRGRSRCWTGTYTAGPLPVGRARRAVPHRRRGVLVCDFTGRRRARRIFRLPDGPAARAKSLPCTRKTLRGPGAGTTIGVARGRSRDHRRAAGRPGERHRACQRPPPVRTAARSIPGRPAPARRMRREDHGGEVADPEGRQRHRDDIASAAPSRRMRRPRSSTICTSSWARWG